MLNLLRSSQKSASPAVAPDSGWNTPTAIEVTSAVQPIDMMSEVSKTPFERTEDYQRISSSQISPSAQPSSESSGDDQLIVERVQYTTDNSSSITSASLSLSENIVPDSQGLHQGPSTHQASLQNTLSEQSSKWTACTAPGGLSYNQEVISGPINLPPFSEELHIPENEIPSPVTTHELPTATTISSLATLSNTNDKLHVLPCMSPGITKHHIRRRRSSSAPPKAVQGGTALNFINSVGRAEDLLAVPPTAPAKVLLINFVQRWALWSSTVIADPEARRELNNIVGEKIENVWLEAMRMGLIPKDWNDEAGQRQMNRTDAPLPQVQMKIVELDKRGRVIQDTGRQRRAQQSPSREIVIDSRGKKGSRNFGITAGELQEAGVSIEAIRERVVNQDPDDDEDLMKLTLDRLTQYELSEHDWLRVVPYTAYNILGRDLRLYCLWEVLRCQRELHFLQNLIPTFKQNSQVRNTQNRIDAEQELHDQLLACAVELGGLDCIEGSSGSGSETDSDAVTISSQVIDVEEDVQDGFGKQPEDTIDVETLNSGHDVMVEAVENERQQDLDGGYPVQEHEAYTQAHGQALAAPLPYPPLGQATHQTPPSRQTVEAWSSVKRAAEDPEAELEPPEKRLRLYDGALNDILNEDIPLSNDYQSHAVRRNHSISSSLLSIPSNPQTSSKKKPYIQQVLRPKVNALLEQAGRQPVEEGTSWRQMREALKDAGIGIAIRNELVRDLNEHLNESTTTIKEPAESIEEVQDISGYPTSQEIFNAFPPEGLTVKDLQETFSGKVEVHDKTWRALVMSVAYYDRASNRFYRQQALADALRHRLVVKLRTKKGFKPEDFSSRTLNNTQGFRWRYMPESTIKQREAIDELVHTFVSQVKECDKLPRTVSTIKYKYHGQYEELVDPGDVLRERDGGGEVKGIVRGVWDLKGRKSEDNRVPGLEWFYGGADGEVIKKWIVKWERGEGGWMRVVEEEKEGGDAEQKNAGRNLSMEKKRGERESANEAKKLTLKIVPGKGGAGSATPLARHASGTAASNLAKSKGKSKPSSKAAKEGAKGKGVKKRSKVKKEPTPPISVGRARRTAALARKYVDDVEDDSDGEYVPS